MSRRAARITQADVARALRAAEQVAPGRLVVEIGADGSMRIIPLAAVHVAAPKPAGDDRPDDPFARGLEIVP